MNTDNTEEPAAPSEDNIDKDTKLWAMILHLSVFAGYVVPLAGLIAPIVIWQVKKKDLPQIDAHGKIVVNFIISMVIYAVVSTVLLLVVVGLFLLIALGIIGVVFPIIGGIKANNGEVWKYPLSISFLK